MCGGFLIRCASTMIMIWSVADFVEAGRREITPQNDEKHKANDFQIFDTTKDYLLVGENAEAEAEARTEASLSMSKASGRGLSESSIEKDEDVTTSWPSAGGKDKTSQNQIKQKYDSKPVKKIGENLAHRPSTYPFQAPPIEEYMKMPLATKKQENDLMELIEHRVPIVASLLPEKRPCPENRMAFPNDPIFKENKIQTTLSPSESKKDEKPLPKGSNSNGAIVFPKAHQEDDDPDATTLPPFLPSPTKNSLDLTSTTTPKADANVTVDNRILLTGKNVCPSGQVFANGACHMTV